MALPKPRWLLELTKTFIREDLDLERAASTGDFDDFDDFADLGDDNMARLDVELTFDKNTVLRSIKKTTDSGVEYWGGQSRRQDIDVFAFYRHWATQMPLLNAIIVEILSTPMSQAAAEKVFSKGRFVPCKS